MSAPSFPEAAEVRAGMRRINAAHERVQTLQKAQIAQAVFGARTCDRVEIAAGLVEALGLLREAIDLYFALMGLQPDDEVSPVIEEAEVVL